VSGSLLTACRELRTLNLEHSFSKLNLPFRNFAFFRAHAPSRASVGASPTECSAKKQTIGEGADGYTRGACAPRTGFVQSKLNVWWLQHGGPR
jgi:hypothetical protein